MRNNVKFTSKEFIAGIYLGSFVLLVLLVLGCNNRNRNQKDRDESTIIERAENTDFTLPLLNALFYEEKFSSELKDTLQLSNEQISELKLAANTAVENLDEDNAQSARSFNQAIKQATTEVVRILGAEKAGQFFAFMAKRYTDPENSLPLAPNHVPQDSRIIVNAPAFRMDVFEKGKLIKTYRIGIGYPEFPLPTGVRKAVNIIFNPTWTPPDEPWVKGKVTAGEKVPAGSELNPLGPIKIPIGLPSLIHGGKNPEKLGAFASHGCVGLTNDQVQDFTNFLSQIAGTPISADKILKYEKEDTKTQTVKLASPVLVELRYETIVAQDGGLHIYRDVYERGTNTLQNATRVLDSYGIKYEKLNDDEKANLTRALDEMNRDARGNVIAGVKIDKNVANAPDSKKREATKDQRAKKGKVTQSVVGQSELVVPIADLQGKGYPLPVDFSTGG
ncbi:L,D-transpeptidase [Sphingobacterium thalpophilum]|uniref:L,D-transpeptidase n=1 Tax=Sphingobacterium thalpophilum TaxID=259 RepID=UPI0024A79873|nr:L,D-transpeptidase [Sphingobacterium thalpophilum]